MTLHWHQTASDCRVSRAFYPHVTRTMRLNDLGRWEGPNPRGVCRDLDDLIVRAVGTLPIIKFWNRTRLRALTRHGLYQMRRDLTRYAEAMAEGWLCSCNPSGCRFPDAPESDETGRPMPVIEFTADELPAFADTLPD